jgi:multisubunit Na+/H+ antiporter MnhB subunit
MSKIVRTTAQFLTPAILLYGLYLIMHGHITSGGGFQGGAVFASSAVLLVVAFGSSRVSSFLQEHRLVVISASGAVMFVALAFAGMGNTFFYNLFVGSPLFGNVPAYGPNPEDIWTGGTVPLMNIAVALNVVAGLAAIVIAMAMASKTSGEDK